MTTRQPQLIVFSVHFDVLVVSLGQLLDSSINMLYASGLAHFLSAVVGVAASTIPVA